MTTTGIEVRALAKTYRTAAGPVEAVRGVDIEVAAGETVALLGPNGAGKSTTIDLLLGLQKPDGGTVTVFARSPEADIELPGRDGIAIAGDLSSELPATRTLILTTFGRPGCLRRALQNGADGFLLKDAPASQLAEAIRTVARGERVIDVQLAVDAIAEGPSPLTQREHDVLAAATAQGDGCRGRAAAAPLRGTVRNYLSAAIRKVGARNRNDARAIAIGKGWIRER